MLINRLLRVAGSLVAAACLTSCATPYGSMGLLGGVEATPLTSDSEMIVAKGNGFTDTARVQQFVLLKAAQDCLARGYSKFGFMSSQDTSQSGAMILPGQTYSNSTITGFGNTATVNTTSYSTPGSVVPVFKPGATVIVKFFKADDPAGSGGLDAQQIASNLGPVLQKN